MQFKLRKIWSSNSYSTTTILEGELKASGKALLKPAKRDLFRSFCLRFMKKFRQSPQDITNAKGGGFLRTNKLPADSANEKKRRPGKKMFVRKLMGFPV